MSKRIAWGLPDATVDFLCTVSQVMVRFVSGVLGLAVTDARK